MLKLQLYISEYAGPPDRSESIVDSIVTCSIKRNEALSVTGGLIFTGEHFAQILEGEASHIDSLMASIERDERHRMLRVFDRTGIIARRFKSWSLTYAGPSHFVSGHLTRLIASTQGPHSKRAEHWLIELMEEFANFEEKA
jgi:hypothetical protein